MQECKEWRTASVCTASTNDGVEIEVTTRVTGKIPYALLKALYMKLAFDEIPDEETNLN